MMLTRKCRFTAFFLIPVILISLVVTLTSHASMDSDDDSIISSSHHSTISEEESLDDANYTIDLDGAGGQVNGHSASSSATPQRPIIAGYGSLNDSAPRIKSTKHRQAPTAPWDIFTFNGANYQSAMKYYPLNASQDSSNFNWDNLHNFRQGIDIKIINIETSKKSIAAGVLGGAIGALPSTLATGTLVSSIGKFFHIPVGEKLSTTMVVWLMVTTTPSFVMNLAERFHTIGNFFFTKETFSTRDELEEALSHDDQLTEDQKDVQRRIIESMPCVFEISVPHKAAIGAFIIGSFIDAVGNLGVVQLAYFKHFPNVFFGLGWSYFLSWMEMYYKTGRTYIDQLFCRHKHGLKATYDTRLRLADSLQKCRQAIAQSDTFTLTLYKAILNEMNKNKDNEDSYNLFALSAFFLKPSGTQDYQPDEETSLIADTRLFNYQLQQAVPLSWKEEFFEKLSTVLTGAAWAGRAVTMQYIFEQVLTEILSLPSSSANTVAWAFSIFDILFRSVAEYNNQQQYMKGWLNSFSITYLGDFQWLRKITGWTSIINGGLFALAKTVAGIAGFNAWNVPVVFQVICLLPAFIQDQAYYGSVLENGINSIISASTTFKQPNLNDSVEIARAHLIKWSKRIEEYIYRWDSVTIENLATSALRSN